MVVEQTDQGAVAMPPRSSAASAAVTGVAAAAAASGLNLQPHARFWLQRTKEFSTWFLLLPEEGRRAVVDEAGGPGFPDHGPSAGDELKATDLLLPELTKAGMLAGGGRCLVLFFTRRSVENVTDTDTKMLNMLYEKKMLPKLSSGELDQFKIAAIDPHTEAVVGVPHDCSEALLKHVEGRLAAGTLLPAEVFLALKLRQHSIATFLDALITIFERETRGKPHKSS